MTVETTQRAVCRPTPVGRWDRIRQRRRLAERDRVAANLAELHGIQALLVEAQSVIDVGWVREAWFAFRDAQGRQHHVTAYDLDRLAGQRVTGACLVGAIVHAGGGPAAARLQPVQRALDLTWHTLHHGQREPVQWCPAPSVRLARVRDLTRWNDHPARQSEDVVELLRAAERAAAATIDRTHVLNR